MARLAIVVATLVALAATPSAFARVETVSFLPTVQAAPVAVDLDVTKCLALTREKALDTKKIVAGLGLTAEQVRATRARLTQYNSVRGFPGLGGLGLTPDQIREIQRRIAVQVTAMHAHPLGWPCPPFKNQAAVRKWMQAYLIANGFRPASLVFIDTSPRQIQFRGIQDGVSLYGAVVKSAARQITVALEVPRPGSGGGQYTFNTPFDA